MRTENWRDFALCAEIGPDLFDGWEGDHHNDPELEQQLRSLCLDCPVSWECLEAAINEERGRPPEERQGFRAGSTPHERWLRETGVTADKAEVAQ